MALIDATKKKVVKKPTGQVAGATTSAYTPEQQQIVDRVNAYRTAKAMDIPGSLDMPDNGIDYASLAPNTSNGGRPETLADVMSGRKTASRTPASMLPSVKNSKNPYTSRTVAGNKANSAGAFYGSAGTPSLGTDIAGNNIMGTLGGRNVIGGKVAVDRTAGIQDPMAQYMQMLSPQSVQQRQKATYDMMAKERRGQLDAIRDKYKAQINEEQAQGQQDLARMRSMNLRSGLGGSDFGIANKIGVREGTQKNVQAIQANQDIEIGNTLNQIEQLAQARIQSEESALQQGFQNMFQVQEYQQAQRKEAVGRVAELAKSGLDLSTIKEKDPDLYNSIAQATDMGDVELEAVMNNNKPLPAKIDYQTIVRGGKIMMFGVDPTTGTMKMIEQEVDMPDNYKTLTADDGTILGIPEEWDGDTSKIITVGNYRKPFASELGGGSGGGVSGGGYVTGTNPQVDSWASQIQMGKAKLSDITGNPTLKSQVVQALDGMSGGQLSAVQNNIKEAKIIVDELLTHPGRTFATGVSSFAVNPLSTQAKDFKAKVERLNALLFLNAIPQMRGMGQLTEREGAKLEASSSITREFGIPESKYKEELERLQRNLGSAYTTIGGGVENTAIPQQGDDIDAFLNSF